MSWKPSTPSFAASYLWLPHFLHHQRAFAQVGEGALESAIPTAGSQPPIEERLQCDGAVARNVVRGVDEGDPPAPGSSEERLPGRAMRSQLGEVPLPKRRPLLWVVPEPPPQIRARRGILNPPIELQARLPNTSRP